MSTVKVECGAHWPEAMLPKYAKGNHPELCPKRGNNASHLCKRKVRVEERLKNSREARRRACKEQHRNHSCKCGATKRHD